MNEETAAAENDSPRWRVEVRGRGLVAAFPDRAQAERFANAMAEARGSDCVVRRLEEGPPPGPGLAGRQDHT